MNGLHEKLAECHPSLTRGQVWCRTCGATLRVNSGDCLSNGWPKCCGQTMTIDSPEEQREMNANETKTQALCDIRSKCIAFMPEPSENPALRKWLQSIVQIVGDATGTNWLGERTKQESE